MDEPGLLRSKSRSDQPKAVDDAGSPIRAIDLRDLPVGEGDAGRAMRRFVKQVRATARTEGGSTGNGQVIVIVLVVGVFVVWGQLKHVMPLTLPTFFLVLFGLLAVSWVIMRRIGFRHQRGGFARTITARGYCGGCGYDLRDMANEAARFVECPECGARWSPELVLSMPFGPSDWDQLGRSAGRVPTSVPLVNDDRGVLVRRIRSAPWRAPRDGRRSWSAEQRRAVHRARHRCGFRLRVLASLSGLAVMGFLSWLLFNAVYDTSGTGATGVVVAMILVIGVSFALMWMGEAGVSNERFVAALRRAGVCACCGSSLADAVDTEDGLKTCTRCRSCWRVGVEPQPETQGEISRET